MPHKVYMYACLLHVYCIITTHYESTLFPCGVNLICVIPGPEPAWRNTDTGLGVPNSNILIDPSAPPVRSVAKHTIHQSNPNIFYTSHSKYSEGC